MNPNDFTTNDPKFIALVRVARQARNARNELHEAERRSMSEYVHATKLLRDYEDSVLAGATMDPAVWCSLKTASLRLNERNNGDYDRQRAATSAEQSATRAVWDYVDTVLIGGEAPK